jgi:hypothetical protein
MAEGGEGRGGVKEGGRGARGIYPAVLAFLEVGVDVAGALIRPMVMVITECYSGATVVLHLYYKTVAVRLASMSLVRLSDLW